MQQANDPSGKRIIKACTDFDLVGVKYPGFVNATRAEEPLPDRCSGTFSVTDV
jgi:hypothetical protein